MREHLFRQRIFFFPLVLILLMIAQFALIRNDANIIDLTLDLSRKVILGVLSVSLSVAIAVTLVNFYDAGIVGLVIGIIVGQSILSLAYPHIIGRFLNTSLRSQIFAALRPAMATIVLLLLASRLEEILITDSSLAAFNWITFFLLAALTLFGVAFAAIVLGLTVDQRRRILQRASFLIAKTSN